MIVMDLALCQRALKLNPDLWFATQLVARVKGKAVFPIKSTSALAEALVDRPGGHCKLDGVVLTAEHAKTFFPVKFLPIADEEELLISLYAAFQSGRTVHSLEAQLARHKKAISSVETPEFPQGRV
jgi:hypothetical protein